ncbi:hypothetical protein [Flavobacterium soyangense]|uniref:Kazal-like domain-containing protein n=1 Tax=Flavobacterium soyangense TaxID=2023265 RepID=A0A930UBG9_9FLAO|nr:hypothetical protein [Flavobacterium soyangense]MBF2707729.1 hypothetical protein [Flavobacterium soyangense]
MKRNRYILIVFLIVTLFNNSCSGDAFVGDIDLHFCGKCAGTGKWTVDSFDFTPCHTTKAECLDWAKRNGYYDKDCILCN